MTAVPELAVVVVTYSPGSTLEDFLASLASASTVVPEVVLADNGSADGAPERAAAEHANVRLVSTGGNIGFGAAANVGVRACVGEWILIANPDVVLGVGAIDELLAATRRWPRASSIGPLIRDPKGEVYPSARELPAIGAGIGHALLGWFWPSNRWTVRYRRAAEAIGERTAGWLSGSCLLVRREAFDAVGGFDTGYFMYFEDLDLGERLGRAGWLNVYVPTAEVVHVGGHSTRRNKSRMLAEHHRSAWRYLSRRYQGPRWLGLRIVLRVGLAVRGVVVRRIPWETIGESDAVEQR